MCGIAGLLYKSRDEGNVTLHRMTNRISHRGPDGYGIHCAVNAGIAHRRLSIIDLEGGKQPLCNENENIWITFNGEIYNYRILREELLKKGHQFKTNSDTEIIVHAYEEWGRDFVKKLRGMFAFCIMDEGKQEFLLYRDHFGIKPLFYYKTDACFGFASEIQALRQIENEPFTINVKALDKYLELQYIPAPFTIYSEVYKLPPAHCLRVGFDGTIKDLNQYWRFEFKPSPVMNETEWVQQLKEVLHESVKAHLVSDVPFGAFLSGGIDSSLVVGLMADELRAPVKTFTIGFNEAEFNELKYAREVSSFYKTEHHEEIVEPDALHILPQLVRHYGEPFGDSSAIPTWYVARLAGQYVKMVLTGDAADELFAGYQSYTRNWSKNRTLVPEHLSILKKTVYRFLSTVNPLKYPLRRKDLKEWLKNIQYFNDNQRQVLWRPEFDSLLTCDEHLFQEVFDSFSSNGHFQRVQGTDFNTYLPGDILSKVDISSMIHSLETRTPFLDINVVEFASTIPENLNINDSGGKWEGKKLLKQILLESFPDEFVRRQKMGFAVPLSNWFGKDGLKASEVKERLLDQGSGLCDYFERKEIERIIESHDSRLEWLLLFLQEWFHQNKES